jgi:hypothetical protein
MGKMLSAAAIDQYRRDGYYYPIRVVSREEAARYRDRLESVERDLGGPLRGVYRIKPHLLFTWLAELVRHPRILDAVEDVLGPDILCWNSSFFTRRHEPGLRVVAPGRDVLGLSERTWSRRGGLHRAPAQRQHAVIPSHRSQARTSTHSIPTTCSPGARKSRSRSTGARPPTSSCSPARCRYTTSSSSTDRARTSSDRRIGYAIRYITRVRQVAGPRTAPRWCGVRTFGHFDPSPAVGRPRPEALALHADISDRQAKILYRGTARTSF